MTGVIAIFIRNCLTPASELQFVSKADTVASALKKMSQHLSLPCIDENGAFVGIISKRSIFETFEQATSDTSFAELSEQPIAPCILKDVLTLTKDNNFEDTIEIITRIPFVPIVEDGKFIGIVKRSDVQKALSVAFATGVQSDRLLLGVPEVEGAFERLFNITHKLGLSVVTCVPFDAGDNLNRRVLLKVRETEKLNQLVQQLERAGFLVIKVN